MKVFLTLREGIFKIKEIRKNIIYIRNVKKTFTTFIFRRFNDILTQKEGITMAKKSKADYWTDEKLVDWFNSYTFADIIESFEYVHARTPALVELVKLGLYNGSNKQCANSLYSDACLDWGFKTKRGLNERSIVATCGDSIIVTTIRQMCDNFGMNWHSVMNAIYGHHKLYGWHIKFYEPNEMDFWDDLERKGYDIDKLRQGTPEVYGL